MIILGIDPGSVRVGYGVLKKGQGVLRHIESGLLPIHTHDKASRLVELERALHALLVRAKPDMVGIEKLYFSKNQKTALEVAQARGVILRTIAASRIPFLEFTPREVKLAVTGDGNATKRGVAAMVGRFLHFPLKGGVADDVTDALAIAITTSHGALYGVGGVDPHT